MKRGCTRMILLALTAVILTGCAKYHERDFIGKTSVQIIETYGEFDYTGMPADADGLYRNCRCGYTIQETEVGFLGTEPEVLIFFIFDSNGIVVGCEKGYRPGG